VLVELGATYLACLPGVPAEMKAIFQEHLAPMMAGSRMKTITVDTEIRGVPEAALAPALATLAEEYPGVYVKSHPRGFEGVSRVLVQLTGRGDEGVAAVESARKELESALEKMNASFEMRTRQDDQ
jgi:molybdopterin-biosynthesis enzyme MoeA-like protein